MATLKEHAEDLQCAIEKAVAEHGSDNTFSFAELYNFHGGPNPKIAGRAFSSMNAAWCKHYDVRLDAKTKRIMVG